MVCWGLGGILKPMVSWVVCVRSVFTDVFHGMLSLWDRSVAPWGSCLCIGTLQATQSFLPVCVPVQDMTYGCDFPPSPHFQTGFWGPTYWRPFIHHITCTNIELYCRSACSGARSWKGIRGWTQNLRTLEASAWISAHLCIGQKVQRGKFSDGPKKEDIVSSLLFFELFWPSITLN